MNDWYIKPLDRDSLLNVRFKRIIEKVDILLKLLKSEHKFDSLKEWDTVCRGLIDSLFADIYWIAEYLEIKNKPNINNPFFIWCRMFDTLKHYDRTKQVANNIYNKSNIETSLLGAPIIRDVPNFLLNWKCKTDNISDKNFKQLMIKFILPMEIDINPSMLFLKKCEKSQYCFEIPLNYFLLD